MKVDRQSETCRHVELNHFLAWPVTTVSKTQNENDENDGSIMSLVIFAIYVGVIKH